LLLGDPPSPGRRRNGPSIGCHNLQVLEYWCRRNASL
jgi:hypothetical protein